jgi:hypothetical protein
VPSLFIWSALSALLLDPAGSALFIVNRIDDPGEIIFSVDGSGNFILPIHQAWFQEEPGLSEGGDGPCCAQGHWPDAARRLTGFPAGAAFF